MKSYVGHKIIGEIANEVLTNGAKQATLYLTPKLTVKATRQGKIDRRSKAITVLITVGTPNYAQRQFITRHRKTEGVFPLNVTTLRYDRNKPKA